MLYWPVRPNAVQAAIRAAQRGYGEAHSGWTHCGVYLGRTDRVVESYKGAGAVVGSVHAWCESGFVRARRFNEPSCVESLEVAAAAAWFVDEGAAYARLKAAVAGLHAVVRGR